MGKSNGQHKGNGHDPKTADVISLVKAPHVEDPAHPARKAWHQIEGETPRAYEAFQTYLKIPLGKRTLVSAWEVMYRKPTGKHDRASGHFNDWAAKNRWKDRAEHWDNHQLMLGMVKREMILERARQRLVDKALDVVNKLVEIAEGEVVPNVTQVSAANSALSRAGLVEYSRVEHTGAYGGPIGIAAEAPRRSERFATMGPDSLLAQYREAIEASEEGE